ncbi:hypothetical protein [Marmoricola sp. RAF53]|uniref:hypothetical protein n=1 Tax=Marmoricola sp. RAF53 TaxID=3233059 RepID=UPI003F9973BE
MKFRPTHLLLPLVAALTFGTLAPAEAAAPTDPVTGLAITQSQGPGHTWKIHASWDAATDPAVTGYRVWLSDSPTLPSSFDYDHANTSGTSVDLESGDLIAGGSFYVIVKTLSPAEGDPAPKDFAPIALDTTGPTGSYTLNRTSGYLDVPPGGDVFEDDLRADFRISETVTPTDDQPGPVNRQVDAGDGTAPKAWTSGTAFTLSYLKKGTFSPKVILTDQFGNAKTVPLPTVTVREDVIGPAVRITRPAKATLKSSWVRIRGTAQDSGTGAAFALGMVIEKRGATWYAYDFPKRKWLKGYSSMAKTLDKTKAHPAFMTVTAGGNWRTPRIKGLTKGTLHVEAFAVDDAFNFSLARPITQKIH